MILPTGVVSKKDIGERNILYNIDLCIIPEAMAILTEITIPNNSIATPRIKMQSNHMCIIC